MLRRPRSLTAACVLGASTLLFRCGARSGLAEPVGSSAADSGADSSVDAATDAGLPDAPPTPCTLSQVGDPVEVLSISASDLHTPSLAVINPGDAASAQPARVALQAIGGAIRLTALTVTGTKIESDTPIVVGGGVTYGQMTHAPGGLEQLALVWGADGPGNLFRTVDIPTWSLGPLVTVAQTGWTPNGLAAGKGVPNTQTGQYAGNGYGMTWQGATGESASVAVLSASGDIQVGPLWTSAPVPSAMLESAISWSGATYLLATRFDNCKAGDPLCRDHAVVVSRLRVAPGSNSIEFATAFEATMPGGSPGYPSLDGVDLVWDEGNGSGSARIVHVRELAEDGTPAGPDHVVSTSARPLARVFTSAMPPGRLVGWAEEGDVGLPEDQPGRSRFQLQGLDAQLTLDGPPLTLGITRYGSMGRPAAVPLSYPRGVLLAWSARSRLSSRRTIFAQLLSCSK